MPSSAGSSLSASLRPHWRRQKSTNKKGFNYISDLDNTPSDGKISEVRTLATVNTAVPPQHDTRGRGGDHGAASDQLLEKSRCHLSHARGVTTELRGLTATQSRPADLFATAAVPGRSAAPDVCVASINAAAAVAAQASLIEKHFTSEKISRPACPRHRLSPKGWTAEVRSRYRSRANVNQRPPAQMETRNLNCPLATKAAMTQLTHQQENNGFSPASKRVLPATGLERSPLDGGGREDRRHRDPT